MSRILSKQELNRRRMLMELGKSELAKPDRKSMLSSLGYDASKKALNPSRNRPPVDNTYGSFKKWVQAALNVVLGTSLKRDGVIKLVTRAVIKRFQLHEGLTAHGYIDEMTLQILELRVGMKAPRSVRHEALPHLLRLPRKGVWKPPGRKKRDQKRKDRAPPGEVEAEAEAGGLSAKVAPGVQQREAEAAVAAVAFDEEFVAMATEQRDKSDPDGLRREMSEWLEQARGLAEEDSPAWLSRMRLRARGEQEEAASIVRRQWWQEHVVGEES